MTIEYIIQLLNGINTELFTVFNLCILITILVLMLRIGGIAGLQGYIFLALIVANIQILKGTNFLFSSEPVPLGTLTYGMIPITLSIITELYGGEMAKKTINLGMIFSISFTLLIFLTIGYKPVSKNGLSQELYFLYQDHFLMKSLFSPTPSILISGLVAYFISERSLVYIQILLRRVVNSIKLRSYISNTLSSFIDLLIMNSLAWIVFNDNPITVKQLFISYIFPTYPFRLLTSLIAIPTIGIALRLVRKSDFDKDKS